MIVSVATKPTQLKDQRQQEKTSHKITVFGNQNGFQKNKTTTVYLGKKDSKLRKESIVQHSGLSFMGDFEIAGQYL